MVQLQSYTRFATHVRPAAAIACHLRQLQAVFLLPLLTLAHVHMCPAVIARTADVPLHHPHHDSLSSADAGDESRCPFLASLRTPPMVKMPWLQRVQHQVRPSSA
jgi:hypothetical protein